MTLPTPRDLGFRAPAEWEPHAATWAAWPFDDELWFGRLEGVRREMAAFVHTVARFEAVRLLVRDAEAEDDARRRLAGLPVGFVRVPLDDAWLRDNGPTFVRDRAGRVSFVHWAFNGWGQKFEWARDTEAPQAMARALGVRPWRLEVVLEGGAIEVDGQGAALTTRQCLLHPKRNPQLGEADYETLLRDYLGVERVIWLERGLEGDHTDGHVDTLARFTDADTIVCSVEPHPADPNRAALVDNLVRLSGTRRSDRVGYRVVALAVPHLGIGPDGERLPGSYANFYIGNGFVVVPQFGDANDAPALGRLRPLFHGREVIGLSARELLIGGGAFHCLTQPQPAGALWRG
ncbi:MAG: agmatine deiminase family protein [Candidatus Rokuibacteriota bacterium]